MKHLLLGAAALLMCSGCLSAYSDGPEYASASPPSGFAVVHIYRPHKSFGALQMIEASQPGRVVILPSGGFATFVVPAGQVQLKSAINTWSEISALYLPGVATGISGSSYNKATETPVAIDAKPGAVYFIRTEFTSREEAPSAELVDTETGSDEIDGLHLAAGGRGRYPVTPWVDAKPEAPPPAPAEAPAAEVAPGPAPLPASP